MPPMTTVGRYLSKPPNGGVDITVMDDTGSPVCRLLLPF